MSAAGSGSGGEANAGSGLTSGEGGMSEIGGSAGSPASSGGSGNSGGTGADTSSCGAAPNANPALGSPLTFDPDTVAVVAAIVGSCQPDDGVDRNAAHVWESDLAIQAYYMRAVTQAECLVNAHCGCAAIEHCLGIFYATADETCVTGCSGETFTLCGGNNDELPEGYRYVAACDRVGLSCDDTAMCLEDERVECSTAGATCSAAGEIELCEDGVIRRSPACGDFGLACVNGACVGTGDVCTGGFNQPDHIEFEATGCDGDLLQACVMGGTTTLDCTTRGPGFHCQTLGEFSFCGLAAECVPAGQYSPSPSHEPSCSDSVLTFCNAGRLEQLDCLALGFTGCEVDGSTQYGCTPGVQISD